MIEIVNNIQKAKVVDLGNIKREDLLDNIVFYYSGNTKYPMFLKQVSSRYGFLNPIYTLVSVSSSLYFEGGTPEESIKKALTSKRQVFILNKSEWEKLFNDIR